MKFKVGDRVRIKKDLNEEYEYKLLVTNSMVAHRGEIMTIEKIDKSYPVSYLLKEDKDCFDWTEDMFEKIKKPTKEELLKMPKGTKVITDKKENNEFIFDGGDMFENKYGDFFWNTDINKDLGLEDEDYGTKIIEIQTSAYEPYWKENNENEKEEINILILTQIINNTIKVKDINLNNLPEERKEEIMKALEEVLN